MLNKYTLIFLLINIAAIAQSSIKSNSNTITYLSRKGVYEIQYSKDHWKKSENASEWDAEFQDNYNILNVPVGCN